MSENDAAVLGGAPGPASAACIRIGRTCGLLGAAGVVLAMMLWATGPARAEWSAARGVSYVADAACATGNENVCLIVSCPAPEKPSLELYAFESGLVAGDEIEVRIDQQAFDLKAAEPVGDARFRWSLAPDMTEALRAGTKASVKLNPGKEAWSILLDGSAAALKRVAEACR